MDAVLWAIADLVQETGWCVLGSNASGSSDRTL